MKSGAQRIGNEEFLMVKLRSQLNRVYVAIRGVIARWCVLALDDSLTHPTGANHLLLTIEC